MKKHSFLYKNSLSLVLLLIFIILLTAQAFVGWKEYNKEMLEKGGAS
jgi:hypothetical protein